jgi:hypothetical protein
MSKPPGYHLGQTRSSSTGCAAVSAPMTIAACGRNRGMAGDGPAWVELGFDLYETYWTRFDTRFGFKLEKDREGAVAIGEPSPPVIYDRLA